MTRNCPSEGALRARAKRQDTRGPGGSRAPLFPLEGAPRGDGVDGSVIYLVSRRFELQICRDYMISPRPARGIALRAQTRSCVGRAEENPAAETTDERRRGGGGGRSCAEITITSLAIPSRGRLGNYQPSAFSRRERGFELKLDAEERSEREDERSAPAWSCLIVH